MVIVKIVDGSRRWSVRGGRKIRDILSEIGLLSEEYIIVKNGKIATPEDEVGEEDEIILYPVVSGG